MTRKRDGVVLDCGDVAGEDHDSSIDAGWNRTSRIDHPKPAYVDGHGRGLSFSSIGFGCNGERIRIVLSCRRVALPACPSWRGDQSWCDGGIGEPDL